MLTNVLSGASSAGIDSDPRNVPAEKTRECRPMVATSMSEAPISTVKKFVYRSALASGCVRDPLSIGSAEEDSVMCEGNAHKSLNLRSMACINVESMIPMV